MSFRGRLTVFMLLIGALPMIVIAVLASRTAEESAGGKADARLFAGLETASSLYEEATRQAEEAARAIAEDPAVGEAVRSGDAVAAQARASELAAANDVKALVLRGEGGAELASVGDTPFALARLELTGDSGVQEGELAVGTVTQQEYLDRVESLTGRRGAIYVEGQPSVTIAGGESVDLPDDGGGNVTVGGGEKRVLTGDLPDDEGQRIALFGPAEDEGLLASSPLVLAVLVVVFLVAFLFVLGIQRTLSNQVAAMLGAARRIGSGDFSQKLPVSGGKKDEMAGLANEFNEMSDRLRAQIEQLRRQRVEIDRSVRRIGEASVSGLDRDGLLEIVTETAVAACGAQYGMIALAGLSGAEITSGSATDPLADAAVSAEARASGGDEPVELSEAGAYALAAPLRPIGGAGKSIGVMSIARMGSRFDGGERDVFRYLIGQASSSIENVALHELVSEQAVTDELTGLANNRSFREVIHKEAARAKRFEHPLSLVMLDIDDFKRVNDAHGHLQGDEVLRRIGAILAAESRGIDEPARYGGEEFAVALPETGSDGAAELAERVRVRIEREEVRCLDGDGTMSVTASLGVATIPDAATDAQALIAAADAALYAAKRGGKNRVDLAPAKGPARRG